MCTAAMGNMNGATERSVSFPSSFLTMLATRRGLSSAILGRGSFFNRFSRSRIIFQPGKHTVCMFVLYVGGIKTIPHIFKDLCDTALQHEESQVSRFDGMAVDENLPWKT